MFLFNLNANQINLTRMQAESE